MSFAVGDKAYTDVLCVWNGSHWVPEELGVAVESMQRQLALQLWQAFGFEPQEFETYFDKNSWADTWSRLLDLVRYEPWCGDAVEPNDVCTLREGHVGPHYGTGDVGPPNDLLAKMLVVRGFGHV